LVGQGEVANRASKKKLAEPKKKKPNSENANLQKLKRGGEGKAGEKLEG